MTKRPPKLIVIVGETASGKSDLAMDIAERFAGEIICADSWTVRREVNIGTAKPSLSEQHRIRHHLLDVVGPDEDFTAAVFKNLAIKAITDIAERNKLPILVGGTGLYIDGVIYDFGFLDEGDRSEREALNRLDTQQLLLQIKALSLSTDGIDIRNKRRLIRLIETNGAQPTKQPLRDQTLLIGLQLERAMLQERVETRVDAMLQAGLEGEVQALKDRYGWDCEALKGVGYSQWRNYFEGTQSLPETRQKIIKATLDLAKRQRTWFKRNKSIHWFTTPVEQKEIVALVTTFLDK